jgi:hypothetical protein
VTRGRKKTQVCDLRFGLPGCNFIFFSTSIAAIYTFSNEIIKLAAVCLFTGQLPPSTKERECFFFTSEQNVVLCSSRADPLGRSVGETCGIIISIFRNAELWDQFVSKFGWGTLVD